LELPPDKVDVNVHPAKAEVRFVEPDQLFSGVARAVRRALLAFTPVPTINTQISMRWQAQPPDLDVRSSARDWGEIDDDVPPMQESHALDRDGSQEVAAPLRSGMPLLRLVGQVGSAFLVAEGPDGLYLVDQHAAHERVLFEKFMAQRGAEIPAQRLLQAVTVELPSEQSRLIEEQLPVLVKLGFEVDAFGPNSYKVRAIPTVLSGSDPAGALQVLIEDFEEDETPLQHEIEARIIARVCKRAAVKAGQSLSPDEQKTLLNDLEACQAPRTCPHGRPTMIHLSIDLLERQFGRRGAR
jgi:DNA mismatch repair protein MutL